ncbi:MAG: HutD family protein [Paracoccus sp. (in: a-proteobacteria)]|nr:HutD family protein [Paracoccus sp. (in: a-proteobacteria)]
MRLIRRADLTGRPWKNGGGTTWDIAAAPDGAGFDDFLWRLSLAGVATDGPFSVFAGTDRTLTLLEGPGISLDFAGGGSVVLRRGAAPLSFPGEAAVTGRVPDGPIVDFNVMTRRGLFMHQVLMPPAGTQPPPDCLAILCRAGHAEYMAHQMTPGDVLLRTDSTHFGPLPDGAAFLCVTVQPVLPARDAAPGQ